MIRRAFYLKKSRNMAENYRSIIDLSHMLNELDCKLDDILTIYKIYHLETLPENEQLEALTI